ncbi:MAG: hypothetical protein AAF902_09750 [Chloroflexota bacterium]
MKQLTEKFNQKRRELNLTLEQVSAGTTKHKGRISYNSLKNLSQGTGGTNPGGNRLFALAKTLRVPVRYLVDDEVKSPYEAVRLELAALDEEDRKKLLTEYGV